jgi:glycosyltransferase involved in cell wall biosynthesis
MPRALGWRIGLGSGYEIEQATFAMGLIRLLRRERADILHVQDTLVALITERARRLGLVRTRTILADGTESGPALLGKFEYLQHLAPWHLEEARAAGAWRPTWTAIPNFVDTDVYHAGRGDALRDELGIPRDALVVLIAAAIRRRHKRVDYLLKEFARLRDMSPDLPAWLVVAGGWEQDTDELIAEGRALLGDRVRFLVRFPRERMPDLYRASDVFVLCSLKEMLGIALLEASASGLPCLVHSHPVLQWVVGPGGVSIDMSRHGALADALIEILKSKTQRCSLGQLARRHCVEVFGRDLVLERILGYYDFVSNHPNRGS